MQDQLQKLVDKKNKSLPKDLVTGEYIIFDSNSYNCLKCQNKGVFYFIEDLEIKVRYCDCKDIRKTYKLIQQSGLMSAIKEKTFKNFEVKTDLQKIILEHGKMYTNNLLKGSSDWFFVSGQSGSGKTHICTAISGCLLKNRISVYYMLWREVADVLNRFSKSSDETTRQDEIFDIIKTVDVLYIDDFLKTNKGENGKMEQPKSWDLNLAFKVINTRTAANKPTIISTEWLLEELYQIDEAITGRIFEKTNKKAIMIPRGIENNYRMQV